MRATTRSNGDIEIVIAPDEASELIQDAMFDDTDTLAVTSRLRDVVQAELDEDLDDDEDEDEDEDLDEDDDGVEPEIIDEVDESGVEPEIL